MKVDWFTVIAQICNLLVLLWILKKLLYKPILKSIEDRQQIIDNQIRRAEEKELEAERIKSDFQLKNEKFEFHKVELYNKLDGEVEDERMKQLEKVRQEADQLKVKLDKTIEEEKENSVDELVQRMEKEILSISEKVLKDLSDYSIQERIVEVFIRLLKTVDEGDKKYFFKSNIINTATVRSAFELTTAQKERIENTIEQENAGFRTIHYEIVPDLICGIELSINNHKISWNIRYYLKSLKELMEEK